MRLFMNLLKRTIWLAFSMGNKVPMEGVRYALVALLAVPLTVFEIWYAVAGNFGRLELAILFVVPMYVISFLSISHAPDSNRTTWFDYFLALVSLVAGIYLILQMGRYQNWIAGLDIYTTGDLTVAAIYSLLTLELLRRCVGPGISVVVWLVILYSLFGGHLSGFFSHRGLNLSYMLESLMVTPHDGGLFSAPIQVAAVYAFLFITFGKFLEKSGGGDFFFNVAALLAGRRTGGSAKIAVTSSGLFGMISGSPASDVMTTGSITIPMMKRVGYTPRYAAAVEAVASTGGSLLPPVMGAVVFLMVEFTGISYTSIIGSILVCSILYYVGIYVQVHCYSARHNVGHIDAADIPTWLHTFRTGWIFVIPMGLLVYVLMSGRTPALAATCGLVAVIVVSWFVGGKAITPRRFVQGCVEICTAIAPLIAAVAGAGILLIGLNVTGLASKLSALIFSVAEANLLLALLLATIVTIISGMGMPVVAVYSLVAVMVAPALVDAGLSLLQAHLFLIFYGVASYITPPVAVAAYVASSIADERPMAVSMTAAKVGLVAFTLPYAFVYNPGILMIGSLETIVFDVIKVSCGVLIMSTAVEGWYHGELKRYARAALIITGLIAFSVWDVAGVTALLMAISYLLFKRYRSPASAGILPVGSQTDFEK
ncbi:TRAP transporter fused permease subunit [Marinobacter salarius]|nr:TRAP transporter fused permease subunit [Marinobacter salarius]